MNDQTEWSTDDLALAAFLVLECEDWLLRYDWDHGSCFVVFKRSELLLDCVTEYVSKDARVEPIQYNLVFARVRNTMRDSRPATARTA